MVRALGGPADLLERPDDHLPAAPVLVPGPPARPGVVGRRRRARGRPGGHRARRRPAPRGRRDRPRRRPHRDRRARRARSARATRSRSSMRATRDAARAADALARAYRRRPRGRPASPPSARCSVSGRRDPQGRAARAPRGHRAARSSCAGSPSATGCGCPMACSPPPTVRLARLPGLPEDLRPGRQHDPHRPGLPRRHLRVPRLVRRRGRDLRRAHRRAGSRRARRARRRRALGGHRRGHRRRTPRPRDRGADLSSCVRNFGVAAAVEVARRTVARRTPMSWASRWPATRPATRPSASPMPMRSRPPPASDAASTPARRRAPPPCAAHGAARRARISTASGRSRTPRSSRSWPGGGPCSRLSDVERRPGRVRPMRPSAARAAGGGGARDAGLRRPAVFRRDDRRRVRHRGRATAVSVADLARSGPMPCAPASPSPHCARNFSAA